MSLGSNLMDYFLDTNVEIGYVFCTDPWNAPAVTVFDSNDKLYYSTNVDEEFQKNLIIFSKQQKQFFFAITNELKNLNFKKITYNEFLSIGLSMPLVMDFAENKKKSCLEFLWNHVNGKNENKVKSKMLIRGIKSFGRNFDNFILKRKNTFERTVILHNRVKEYSLIFGALENLGIHEEDNNIILDAHDLATRESLDLNFITSDNDVYELPQQVSTLNINEFLHLRDFK